VSKGIENCAKGADVAANGGLGMFGIIVEKSTPACSRRMDGRTSHRMEKDSVRNEGNRMPQNIDENEDAGGGLC
jgi:hypothetical protein